MNSVTILMNGQKFEASGNLVAVQDPGHRARLWLYLQCTWHGELDLWGPATESPGFVYIQREGWKLALYG